MNFPLWINPSTMMPWKGKKGRKLNQNQGIMSWESYYQTDLLQLALSRFSWSGLPNGCTSEWLESQLLFSQYVVAWKQPDILDLRIAPAVYNQTNMYNQPITAQPLANGNTVPDNLLFPKNIDITGLTGDEEIDSKSIHGVIIRDNTYGFPLLTKIWQWASKLAFLQEKIDTNVETSITPVGLHGNVKTIESIKKGLYDAMNGKHFVAIDTALEDGSNPPLDVIDLATAYHANDFQQLLDTRYSQALTALGINTINIQKKERLITSEAEGNDDLISRYVGNSLEERQLACKKINEMFNTNLSVKANGKAGDDKDDTNSINQGVDDSEQHDPDERDDEQPVK